MSNVIRIKRRAAGGSPGAPASLLNAEIAFNESDEIFYIGIGTGGTGGSATSALPIGGPGAFVTRGTDQTVSGNKTFSNPIGGSITGNAATATRLLNSRQFSITGDITAPSVSFNGQGNVSLSATLSNTGVAAGSYTKVTVDAKGRVTAGATARLSELSAPNSHVSFDGYKLTDLATPTNSSDAATKAYVDAMQQGMDPKESVRVATTGNITLSGTQTIDGVAVSVGDRVLVKNQSTASTNGIYIVASGAWTRSPDANTSDKVTAGLFTFVETGTVNANSGWILTTNDPITVGSTGLAFTQFSGAGQIDAGDGLTKTGNRLDVGGTANRISVNGSSIDIAATYQGQSSITVVGTISTGTWQAGIIALNYGGSGRNLSSDADGSIYKKNGTQLVPAIAGQDFLNDSSTIDGGTF